MTTTLDRFTVKALPLDDGCWLWCGYVMPNGYGQFRTNDSSLAHRFAYTAHVGPVPDGLDLDHLCRNRWCVNPAHLEPVSRSENLRRGVRKLQQQTCKNGHPLSGDNLKPAGQRQCRACANAANRRYQQRQRAANRCTTQPNQEGPNP